MTKNNKKSSHSISIRLHTNEVENYEEVLRRAYKEGGSSPAQVSVIDRKYGQGVAFFLTDQPSHPEWANDFETFIASKNKIPENRYSKAVIVLKVTSRKGQTRFMSIAFGYGESLLDSSKYESDFGRNIAAQKVPDSRVLSAGTLQISDAIIQMEKQYMGTKNSGMRQLVTSQSEFPSSISGTWRNGEVETKLEGRGSLLKAKRLMDLSELVNDLKIYLEAYLDPAGMAEWATRLTQITSGGLKDKLASMLMERLISNDLEYGVAWPDYKSVDELSTDLLKNIPGDTPVKQIKWYVKHQVDVDPNYGPSQLLKKIRRSKLNARDDNGVVVSVPLYSSILAELIDGGHRYLLFNGSWYQVKQDFYNSLEEKLRSVPIYEMTLPALTSKHDNKGKLCYENEGDYNIKLTKSIDGGRLFDKVNFKNSQGNRFVGVEEPADVITRRRELFFVKKGDSSAALSHLFLQGLVSAKLLARDGTGEFRHFVNHVLGVHPDVFSDDIMNSDVTLVFVIIRKSSRLPFFSMVSFSEVLNSLREMGYKVKLAWPSIKSPRF